MGGCASTLKQWKEEAEAEHDEEVKAAAATPTPPAVGLAPASYVPAPPAVNGNAAVPPAAGGLAPGQDGAPLPWHYRNSQELSMAHLVRHPRAFWAVCEGRGRGRTGAGLSGACWSHPPAPALLVPPFHGRGSDPGGHLLQQRAHEPHPGGAAVAQPPGAGAGL